MTAPEELLPCDNDVAREIARAVINKRHLQRDNGLVYSAAFEAAKVALSRPDRGVGEKLSKRCLAAVKHIANDTYVAGDVVGLLEECATALRAPGDEATAVCPKNDDKLWTEAEDLAACERAIDRMGWPELHAFFGQPGQSPSEDAGGHLLRKIKSLFGITPDPVESYRDAMRGLVDEAKKALPPQQDGGHG